MATAGRVAERAEVIVIGGGIIGSSIAYHLCRAGITDVLVLERNELSSGATARSAGCVLHARSDPNTIRMISRTRAAILELEEQLGESLDFRQVGCIRAVLSEERERDMRQMEAYLAQQQLPVEELDAREARALCPWLDLFGARRITYLACDGYIDGARLGMAYARAARGLGARIRRGVAARNVIHEEGRVCGVETDSGPLRANWVIDAAGAWGVEIAAKLGWGYPAAPTRSHYWITAPDGAGEPTRPNVQLPDLHAYFRSELGGLLVGFQESRSSTFDPMRLERDMASMQLIDDERDMDLLLEHAAALRAIVPDVDRWGFAHHIAGLSVYTPDGKFVIGPVPGFQGLLVAGGCCGTGVAASGGFGQAIAEIIAHRPLSIDIGLYRPDRFGIVDPASPAFRGRCAAARAGKSGGAPNSYEPRISIKES